MVKRLLFSETIAIAFFLVIQFTGEIECEGLLGGALNTLSGLVANGVTLSKTLQALSKFQTVIDMRSSYHIIVLIHSLIFIFICFN